LLLASATFEALTGFSLQLKEESNNKMRVAILINSEKQQYEGLRSSPGMLLYNTRVEMYVLNHEIANMDEAYEDNMGFFDETEKFNAC
jgi:hypothetical protein